METKQADNLILIEDTEESSSESPLSDSNRNKPLAYKFTGSMIGFEHKIKTMDVNESPQLA